MTSFLESWQREIDRAQREAERGAALAAAQLARVERGEGLDVWPIGAAPPVAGSQRKPVDIRAAVFKAIAEEGVAVTMETAERLADRVAREVEQG